MKTSKLRRGERCPIHSSYYCCGREKLNHAGVKAWRRDVTKDFNSRLSFKKRDWKQVAPGVWQIPDEHHPRGYREQRSPAAMRILLRKKVEDQKGLCALCGEPFTDYRQAIPEHILPKGMNGGRRDDHPDNIQAAHNWPCNIEKGSKRP